MPRRLQDEHIATYPRLQRGAHFADFKSDKRLHPPVYHCIIQQNGASKILWWSQHGSLQDAVSIAREELARLAGGEAMQAA